MIVVFFLCLAWAFPGVLGGAAVEAGLPHSADCRPQRGMRNISAGAVLAEAYFPGDVLFPVAFSPVFLQATTA